ncbi:MAG: hypothetical protein M1358_17065 [Chloroflexi bacterium]|nr:hypothetical protein [Chloroflexota bacterium]
MRDSAINQGRHLRALCFVLASLVSSLFAYLWLGFDAAHTIGYAVASYLTLIALNFHVMFAKQTPQLIDDEEG